MKYSMVSKMVSSCRPNAGQWMQEIRFMKQTYKKIEEQRGKGYSVSLHFTEIISTLYILVH